ncbi:MAG: alanine--tRNA ligase [Robiginitomaculum sp.]|nr:MAG: alanine--tRNA ligase [Robiginitomaculum sp.]
MTALRDIRKQFLGFFEGNDHQVMKSSPLVPDNDPTLLFTNAGMVQFKNYFTGAETPKMLRAATSQKCVRAGGKHNDLDNVGYTARHHTFFEMLGNFSFGDYFKEDAIKYGWDLLTKDLGLSKDKLLVTVYHTDDEARKIWKKVAGLSDSQIISIATSDNFWAMGDTGPCGPCSEIFYDHGDNVAGGPPGSPDEDGDRFIEIWNLVFMQYEKFADGTQSDLPKPSIDTGMGLERIAAILQGVHNNYDIDLFKNLIAASVEETKVKAEGDAMFSHRVITDHLRSASFLIADGVSPSKEGRGYVLRRIMRRAMRHAHILGTPEPLMHRLVPALVEEMGDAFGELKRAQENIETTMLQEEEQFRRTLGRGTALLDAATSNLGSGDTLPGDVAFKLYDTYGFPLDLTQDALRSKGIEVDVKGYDKAMKVQKDTARAHWAGSGDAGSDAIWLELREKHGATEFSGYENLSGGSAVLALIKDGVCVEQAEIGDEIHFLTKQTPFYAESGGQAGDKGVASFANGVKIEIVDVKKRAGDVHVHVGKVISGTVNIGDVAALCVDADIRANTRRNHSATHLVHEALRRVLGTHVTQKGQMVDGERIRFDFSHGAAVSPAELAEIEAQVNAVILENSQADTKLMAPEEAIEAGAMALFGEKYGDEVRVFSLGNTPEGEDHAYSVELCGGTHVARTGDIALFKITSEGAVAAGIRRVEAVTGAAARQYLEEQAGFAKAAADVLKIKPADVPDRIALLTKEKRQLEKDLAKVRKELALGGGGASASAEEINGVKFMGRVLQGVSGKDLRAMIEEQKQKLGSGIVAFVAVDDGKVNVAVGVTSDLTGTYNAATLVNMGAEKVGGRGGGRPDMAQAGGSQVENADAALAAVKAGVEAG